LLRWATVTAEEMTTAEAAQYCAQFRRTGKLSRSRFTTLAKEYGVEPIDSRRLTPHAQPTNIYRASDIRELGKKLKKRPGQGTRTDLPPKD
jgi:hypothetical protein